MLSINAEPGERGTVLVEPNVSVGQVSPRCPYSFAQALLRGCSRESIASQVLRSLAPTHMLAVCLELEDATLGGLAMGVGMTTASHIFGLYQETIVSMKVVVADGSLVHATRTNQHAELFKCLPWSHGSLGFLVELELLVNNLPGRTAEAGLRHAAAAAAVHEAQARGNWPRRHGEASSE